jgi:hypothetical protein
MITYPPCPSPPPSPSLPSLARTLPSTPLPPLSSPSFLSLSPAYLPPTDHHVAAYLFRRLCWSLSPRSSPPSLTLTLTLTQLTLHPLALTSPHPAFPASPLHILSPSASPPTRDCWATIYFSVYVGFTRRLSPTLAPPPSHPPVCLAHPLPLSCSTSPSLTLITLPPSVTSSCLPSAVAFTPSRILSYPCRNLITSYFTFLIARRLL